MKCCSGSGNIFRQRPSIKNRAFNCRICLNIAAAPLYRKRNSDFIGKARSSLKNKMFKKMRAALFSRWVVAAAYGKHHTQEDSVNGEIEVEVYRSAVLQINFFKLEWVMRHDQISFSVFKQHPHQ